MRSFHESVVVITGAGSGIGRATALGFAREGARLHLVDISAERLARVQEDAHRLGALVVETHALDCSDAEAMMALGRQIFAAEGRVDVLQNGVGMVMAMAIERMQLADWRRVLDTNLWSVVHGVQAFVPGMLVQGSESHLVNIASVAGQVGFPYTAAYSASKAAVVALSEALSAELYGRGINVTVVCPGMVRTNLLAAGVVLLPGRWGERVRWLHDHFGPPPERVARQIMRAIRHRRPVVGPSLGFGSASLCKRASADLYLRVARQLLRRVDTRPEQ